MELSVRQLGLVQGSKEWHSWRSNGIGGSEAPIVKGLGKKFKKSRRRLWAEKKGLERPVSISHLPHVKKGNLLEPVARNILAHKFNTEILPVCFEDIDNPHRRVSLDGFGFDGYYYVPFEIKCPCRNGFDDVLNNLRNSEDYLYYQWQVQYQIALTNAPYGYLAFYNQDSSKPEMKIFKVERDEKMIIELLALIDEFWAMVVNCEEPEMDLDLDTFVVEVDSDEDWQRDANQLHVITTELMQLTARMKELNAQKEEITKRFEEETEGFVKYQLNNLIVSRSCRTQVDYKAMAIAELGEDKVKSLESTFYKVGKQSTRVYFADKERAGYDANAQFIADSFKNLSGLQMTH
ncbi:MULTISPECIES: lambda-exonuclease family protein [Vibrio]|uniref:lambda-exonuclease family protein n=2 Tax=Vibrionaceae TaxID=641 RepID=UPI00084167D0|nr:MULTISPECIES: YqaJ viral recombinase family protein [Vibrio]ODM56849.1 hypothetical protein BC455_18490 [Vibrio harveyi]USD58509.1 YqaJ viral recombinase family protein [Vibrio sp. SCSIO 43155]